MLDSATTDRAGRYAGITHARLTDPGSVARAAAARLPHPGFGDGQVLLVAADHPARGELGVGDNPTAMADRRDMLDRLRAAIARPGVDGVLASPDVIDDLLLMGALDHKLIFGSMNRGGLRGAAFELEDRFTGYTPAALADLGATGGKALVRICPEDPATVRTLEWTGEAITDLAAHHLYAMIEPFWSRWLDGKVENLLSPDAVIASVHVAQGLGATSAYTILKLPVVAEMERVMAATTLPTVLLGGEPGTDAEATYESWRNALALPGVVGLTVGRTLLYPPDDDVAAAVDTAASLLRRAPS